MSFLSVMAAVLWIVVIPFVAGAGIVFLVVKKNQEKASAGISAGTPIGASAGSNSGILQTGIFGRITLSWFFGQLILWCVFQFIAVYNILKEKPYEPIKKEFLIATILICVISAGVFIVSLIKQGKSGNKLKQVNVSEQRFQKKDSNEHKLQETTSTKTASALTEVFKNGAVWEKIILILVILGIIVQVVLQIVLAYNEVDDSYYVSEATTAIGADKLYATIPYTGWATEFDARHGLAPFPVWLGLLADLCKCKAVSMAHVIIPAFFLPLTYAVYALFGELLLGEKKRYLPVFMLFTELLTVFGFYSYMTPEKFFVTRLREGKATIASLIIPGIVMCLFLILKSLGENKKIDIRLYFLLFVLNVSGCLCSTLGALLCLVPTAVCAIFAIFMYKKGRHLLPMIIACLPCLLFAGLYLIY